MSLQQGCAAWVAHFSVTARAAGIDDEVLRAAFAEVRYLPRVVELDRAHLEFTRTVWDDLDRTATPQRIVRGQFGLSQVRDEVDAAAARYGVPPSIAVAIWSMDRSCPKSSSYPGATSVGGGVGRPIWPTMRWQM